MPGLAPFKTLLAIAGTSGDRRTINARGTTVFIRKTNADLEVSARSLQVGDGGGEIYTVTMNASEKWFTASEFDQIVIRNTGGVVSNVEIYIGYGDFVKPVPDILNFAMSVPASRTIVTIADKVNIDIGNAGKESIAPIDLTRTRLIVTALASNGDIIRIGDTNVGAARGVPLQAGESIAVDSTAEVFACSESVNNQSAAVYLETL